MPRKVFHAAVLTLALAFTQVAVAAGGTLCGCEGGSMNAMPGSTPVMSMSMHTPAAPGTHGHAPCSQPMPHTACLGMVSCGSATMAVSLVRPQHAMVLPAAAHVATDAVPRSVARSPEPPPPRA